MEKASDNIKDSMEASSSTLMEQDDKEEENMSILEEPEPQQLANNGNGRKPSIYDFPKPENQLQRKLQENNWAFYDKLEAVGPGWTKIADDDGGNELWKCNYCDKCLKSEISADFHVDKNHFEIYL